LFYAHSLTGKFPHWPIVEFPCYSLWCSYTPPTNYCQHEQVPDLDHSVAAASCSLGHMMTHSRFKLKSSGEIKHRLVLSHCELENHQQSLAYTNSITHHLHSLHILIDFWSFILKVLYSTLFLF